MIGNPTPRTALATTDDTTVSVFNSTTITCLSGYIVNLGSVVGFFRINGGDWCVLPATGSVEIRSAFNSCDIARVTSGSNLASVWFIGFNT